MNLVQRLIETEFMPHGYCYLWFPEVLWLHVVSDGLIALAYFLIPVSLCAFVIKRREIPFPWIFLMFAAFITACGLTHVMGIWTVWNPDYGVQGLVKLGTGMISLATATTLIPLLPKALALRSPAELEALNGALAVEVAEHRRTEAALRAARNELEERVAARTAELSRANARLQAEIEERKRVEEQRELLLAELSHRVKNTLAVVQALTERTGDGATSVAEFRRAFAGRLQALATAHGLLTAGSWQGASLVDLAQAALAPYLDRENNVRVEVEDLALRPHVAQTFALAFHELATNASKHGALSTAGGRVVLSGGVENGADGKELRLVWREEGGPPVRPPERVGFGTTLLTQAIEYQHEGRVALEWREDGLIWPLSLPLEEVTGAADRPPESPSSTTGEPRDAVTE